MGNRQPYPALQIAIHTRGGWLKLIYPKLTTVKYSAHRVTAWKSSYAANPTTLADAHPNTTLVQTTFLPTMAAFLKTFFELEPITEDSEIRLPNTFRTNATYFLLRTCRARGIQSHPAHMPEGLAAFFIEFLIEPGVWGRSSLSKSSFRSMQTRWRVRRLPSWAEKCMRRFFCMGTMLQVRSQMRQGVVVPILRRNLRPGFLIT